MLGISFFEAVLWSQLISMLDCFHNKCIKHDVITFLSNYVLFNSFAFVSMVFKNVYVFAIKLFKT